MESGKKKTQVRHSKLFEGLINFFTPFLFSKGEFSLWDSNPSLEKRGRGDFLGEARRELFGEPWFKALANFAVKELGGKNV
jgi:hypothetical protein